MTQDTSMKIFESMKNDLPEMVSTLETITNIDSPSTDKACIDHLVTVLDKLWQDAGCSTRIIPESEMGNHLRVEWGSGEKQILLLCHMDTVWDKGEASKRPFRTENGRAFGPGVYDMKAGIIEALFAVKTLTKLGLKPSKKIVILHNSDEELGSPTSRAYIEEEAKKSQAVLVLEPSASGGKLKTWRKGVGMFQINITGRAAHAGSDYEKGVSAISEAARQVIYLHNLTDLKAGTTVNVGVIGGGSRSNVVADNAFLDVDIRVKTMDAATELISKMQGLKPLDPRTSITVKGGLNRPPMERNSKNLALFQLARSIGIEMGLDLLESGTGGASDGNFTSALGIPTLDGLGAVGDGGHALSEYIEITSLAERGALVAGLMLKL